MNPNTNPNANLYPNPNTLILTLIITVSPYNPGHHFKHRMKHH